MGQRGLRAAVGMKAFHRQIKLKHPAHIGDNLCRFGRAGNGDAHGTVPFGLYRKLRHSAPGERFGAGQGPGSFVPLKRGQPPPAVGAQRLAKGKVRRGGQHTIH